VAIGIPLVDLGFVRVMGRLVDMQVALVAADLSRLPCVRLSILVVVVLLIIGSSRLVDKAQCCIETCLVCDDIGVAADCVVETASESTNGTSHAIDTETRNVPEILDECVRMEELTSELAQPRSRVLEVVRILLLDLFCEASSSSSSIEDTTRALVANIPCVGAYSRWRRL